MKMKAEDKSQAVQFLLTEFEAAISRQAMHQQSEENLLNIHLTIVSLAGGGLATLWLNADSTLAVPITLIGLFVLFVFSLTIERRVINHVLAIRWDGYRYRLIQQFFLDKYPDSDISSYIEWPKEPEDAIVIHRKTFERSSVAIPATVSGIILMGILYLVMMQLSFQVWYALLIAIILGGSSLILHRISFHKEAKRQGMTLSLKQDVNFIRQPKRRSDQKMIVNTLKQKKR
jgi:hypothetical protein